MQEDNLNLCKDSIHKLKNHLNIYTDDALAKHLGVSPSAISQWYQRGIPKRFINEYAHLFTDEQKSHSSKDVETIGSHLIPVVGIADAGKGIDSIDGGFPSGYSDEWITRPQGMKDHQAYAVIIRTGAGSMLPLLKPGMKVIASPNLECKSGDLAIIRLKNGDTTIKELKFSIEEVTLIAWNVDYEPHELNVHKKDIEFCHPIIWFRTTH